MVVPQPTTPCVRCNKVENTPQAFLIECCRCNRAWHHSCHIPPLTEKELMRRMDADEHSKFSEGLGSWVCRRCTKRAPRAQIPDPEVIEIEIVQPPVQSVSTVSAAVNQREETLVQGSTIERTSATATGTLTSPRPSPLNASPALSTPFSPNNPNNASPDSETLTEYRHTSITPKSTAQPPSPSPSDASSIEIITSKMRPPSSLPVHSGHASSKQLSDTAPSSSNKGKGKMPDIHSLLAQMRAEGRLNAPPSALDFISPPEDDMDVDPPDADDREPSRARQSLSYLSLPSRSVSVMGNNFADMHVAQPHAEPYPHSVDDLYEDTGPIVVGRSGSLLYPRAPTAPIPGASFSGASSHKGKERDRGELTPPAELDLLFTWQKQLIAETPQGERDELDRMLAYRMQRVQLRKESAGVSEGDTVAQRKSRKQSTRRLSSKQKQKIEAKVLRHDIDIWVRDRHI